MVVRGCKIKTSAGGITFEISDQVPRNNYIVDNDVVGAANWTNDQLGADGYDGMGCVHGRLAASRFPP